MRELSFGPAPPVTETKRFLDWTARALDEIRRGSIEDRNPDAISNTLSANAGALEDLQALTDPNADRGLLWDDSEGKIDWLTIGTGLAISVTTLSLSHLGLESLSDPGADRIVFWDDTATATAFLGLSGLTITDTTLAVDAATTSAAGVLEIATAAEVRSAAAGDKAIVAALLESAAAEVTLTDAATIALDWDTGVNFTVELTTDRILGNPSNGQPGTWRTVRVTSDGGADTLTFGTNYGGAPPTLSDITTTKHYLLMIYCVTTSHFLVSAIDGSAP